MAAEFYPGQPYPGEVGAPAAASPGISIFEQDTTVTSESVGYYSELLATRETVTLLSVEFVNKSDATATSENVVVSVTLLSTETINRSDSVTTSESVTVAESFINTKNITVSDSTTTSESNTKLILTEGAISVADATATSENVALLVGGAHTIKVSDSTITSENVSFGTGVNIVRTLSFTLVIPAPIAFTLTQTTF